MSAFYDLCLDLDIDIDVQRIVSFMQGGCLQVLDVAMNTMYHGACSSMYVRRSIHVHNSGTPFIAIIAYGQHEICWSFLWMVHGIYSSFLLVLYHSRSLSIELGLNDLVFLLVSCWRVVDRLVYYNAESKAESEARGKAWQMKELAPWYSRSIVGIGQIWPARANKPWRVWIRELGHM